MWIFRYDLDIEYQIVVFAPTTLISGCIWTEFGSNLIKYWSNSSILSDRSNIVGLGLSIEANQSWRLHSWDRATISTQWPFKNLLRWHPVIIIYPSLWRPTKSHGVLQNSSNAANIRIVKIIVREQMFDLKWPSWEIQNRLPVGHPRYSHHNYW